MFDLFLDPHLTTYHSNTCVHIIAMYVGFRQVYFRQIVGNSISQWNSLSKVYEVDMPNSITALGATSCSKHDNYYSAQ